MAIDVISGSFLCPGFAPDRRLGGHFLEGRSRWFGRENRLGPVAFYGVGPDRSVAVTHGANCQADTTWILPVVAEQ